MATNDAPGIARSIIGPVDPFAHVPVTAVELATTRGDV